MNKMRTKASQQNKFLRIITIPIRALSKARDSYIKGMTNYAGRMNLTDGVSNVSGLPRSFSVNSARSDGNEEYRDLVRVSSVRSIGFMIDVDSYIRQQMEVRAGSRPGLRTMPPRSSSVAMGRIDEESPCCYFGEENCNIVKVKNELYTRSQSHSVTRRSAF